MARRGGIKSFAQLVVENGLASEEEMAECLSIQVAAQGRGETGLEIEQVVLDRGFMTDQEVRAIKTALGRLARDEKRGEVVRVGGYEITGTLGDGGLGTVYRARQVSMGRDVALKVLHKKWLTDEEFKKRFLLEARLVGRLSHQNLIQVFEVGKDPAGNYYFSMEYIDGQTVQDMIDREGALDIDKALDIITQVLRAVTYIWGNKIVHRDIKPSNVMMTRSGIAKLGDFGFVKSKFDSILSTEGEVLGTPDYIAPEQAMGYEDIDFRSDVYSLGVTFYHMVTGNLPYDGSGSAVMRKHIKADLPDPREFNPDIPDTVCHIIEKMTAKDPDDRYDTTDELFEDLELVKLGRDPLSERPGAGKSTIIRAFKAEHNRLEKLQEENEGLQLQLSELRQRHRYAKIGLAILAIVVLALVVFLLVRS